MIVDQWSANISEIVNQWDIATFRQADSLRYRQGTQEARQPERKPEEKKRKE